jgi:hypothetical protein
MDDERWGATPGEWAHFDLVLGLGGRLLPVVSNQNAKLTAGSKLKAGMLPKTPSRYYGKGDQRVAGGIRDWPNYETTAEDLAAWSEEPDYGIAFRTGHGEVALDADFEDEEMIHELGRQVYQLFGAVPVRFRDSSPRRVFLLRIEGTVGKGVAHRVGGDARGGALELLGLGQQFVAAGTHKTGDRYRWSVLEADGRTEAERRGEDRPDDVAVHDNLPNALVVPANVPGSPGQKGEEALALNPNYSLRLSKLRIV